MVSSLCLSGGASTLALASDLVDVVGFAAGRALEVVGWCSHLVGRAVDRERGPSMEADWGVCVGLRCGEMRPRPRGSGVIYERRRHLWLMSIHGGSQVSLLYGGGLRPRRDSRIASWSQYKYINKGQKHKYFKIQREKYTLHFLSPPNLSSMAYEDDPYRDEDGEPLMNPDDFDREPSPEPLLDVDEDAGDWRDRERSQTPVYDPDASSKSRPRKRLVKKGGGESQKVVVLREGEYWPEGKLHELMPDSDEEEEQSRGKRMKKEKRHKGEKRGLRLPGKSSSDKAAMAGEVKEMWDTVGAGDSEDDNEGQRNFDDDNFIDDTGVHPSDRYASDNDRSPSHHPQAEEGEENEIDALFRVGKRKKKNERSPAEIAMVVENIMADLEVTAEEDADLNRQGKPAINKLKKVSLLTEVLSKKQLQQEFLDHGVLTLLKNWLEPLPDGSLPNINIRAAILKILTDYPLDLEQFDRREQLKRSGLGKVIMFLSKSDEETASNRKLAKELVDKWSRPLFNKSTRFEDMRNVDEERVPFRRPPVKKPASSGSGMESRDGDLDLDEFSRERKSGQSSSRQLTSRPEATQMDFVVRPQSKIDPDEIRARGKQAIQDQRRMKMNRKLQQLKAPKKKQLQATKLSVEGRGMVKYL